MKTKIRVLVTVVSLFIGLLGTIAGITSAYSTKEQVKISHEQSDILKEQYEASKANILIAPFDNPFRSCIFPIGHQSDTLVLANHNELTHRILLDVTIVNQSSLPITIIGMRIYFDEQKTATANETHADKYIVQRESISEKTDKITSIPIKEREYPSIFALGPYEGISKIAIFPTTFTIDNSPSNANLEIVTSRGVFHNSVKIYKLPGESYQVE